MKRKARVKWIVAAVIIALFMSALTIIPELALRSAVFMYSPKSSISMQFRQIEGDCDQGQLYKITKNPPVERDTDAELTTWIVCSYGPFHVAHYYGEG